MKSSNAMRLTTIIAGFCCAGLVAAQQQSPFPDERVAPATCEEIEWHENMLVDFPDLMRACQEAVVANGETWARFAAEFQRVQPDGRVDFIILEREGDRGGRIADRVTIEPAPGQTAYINEQRMAFEDLTPGEPVNLYVAEGQYGFATIPGASTTQVARTTRDDDRMLAQERTMRDEPRPLVLPATASALPWAAFGGLLSLIGGLALTLRRKF